MYACGFAKDYGINGCLPKGSPPIIPFPFASFTGTSYCFLFSLFLLKIIHQGRATKEEQQTNYSFKK